MKLIVTDLDNTLLRSDKTISEYTAKVFESARKKGCVIAFATARGCAVSRFIEVIKPDFIISNGGASIQCQGEIIYRSMVSAQDVKKIIDMSCEFTNGKALITVENDDGYYCNFVPTDPDRRAVFTYTDFENFHAAAYKVSPELQEDAWAEAIAEACPNCDLLNFTGEKWRRYAAHGADKENGLKRLAEHIGMELKDVIAFGDDTNDLGMLQLAGTAVAVSNAIDEVKAAADFVTDSNDQDGVAVWLEKYFGML